MKTIQVSDQQPSLSEVLEIARGESVALVLVAPCQGQDAGVLSH